MRRLNNWQTRFADCLEDYMTEPFAWGSNDCLCFVDDMHYALTGHPFAPDWLGQYKTPLQAARWYRKLLAEQNCDTIIDAIDRRLTRFDGKMPPVGSIVARPSKENVVTGYALGVCIGAKVAYVGDDGLIFMPFGEGNISWLVQ